MNTISKNCSLCCKSQANEQYFSKLFPFVSQRYKIFAQDPKDLTTILHIYIADNLHTRINLTSAVDHSRNDKFFKTSFGCTGVVVQAAAKGPSGLFPHRSADISVFLIFIFSSSSTKGILPQD